MLVLRESALAQVLVGGLVLAGIGAWVRWPDARGRGTGVLGTVSDRLDRRPGGEVPTLSRAEIREYLGRRHPDWDDDRLERVVQATVRGSDEE